MSRFSGEPSRARPLLPHVSSYYLTHVPRSAPAHRALVGPIPGELRQQVAGAGAVARKRLIIISGFISPAWPRDSGSYRLLSQQSRVRVYISVSVTEMII